MTPWLTVYCAVFALAYAWGLVWILERKEKRYGLGTGSYTDAFLSAAFVSVFVYFSNVVALLKWPRSAPAYDLALLAVLAAFGLRREKSYRARAKKEK